ncbi:hypothetical protein [uncultured Clostridium sp.]|uniref:hypothetical protein n=1 Tax=uncultured Clostridium sp. TaxID=59620 RepID=UPI0026159897|nr:hypothetical protein [uncultured Clostridium sp.]
MRGKISYFKIVLIILGISLSMNIYLSVNHYIYKTKALKNTYSYMLGIRDKVEGSLVVVDGMLETGQYKGVNILTIYDNVAIISSNMIDLWEDYNFYENKPIINSTKIESDRNVGTDIFFIIEEYMKNMLINVMEDNKGIYKLTKKEKEDFLEIQSLLIEISGVFKTYDENELKGLEGKEREEVVVKKEYWIDMLDKINNINIKFSDYNFSKENKVVNEI